MAMRCKACDKSMADPAQELCTLCTRVAMSLVPKALREPAEKLAQFIHNEMKKERWQDLCLAST